MVVQERAYAGRRARLGNARQLCFERLLLPYEEGRRHPLPRQDRASAHGFPGAAERYARRPWRTTPAPMHRRSRPAAASEWADPRPVPETPSRTIGSRCFPAGPSCLRAGLGLPAPPAYAGPRLRACSHMPRSPARTRPPDASSRAPAQACRRRKTQRCLRARSSDAAKARVCHRRNPQGVEPAGMTVNGRAHADPSSGP